MPENTEHLTQKPEELIARLVLASSNERDMVFDPFLVLCFIQFSGKAAKGWFWRLGL